MKEYKCIKIGLTFNDTEDILNDLAKDGWKVVASYSKHCYWIILERDKK